MGGLMSRLIRMGSRGNDVTELQRELNQYGYTVAVDGIFGKGTLAAVKAFQTDEGLVADGLVGKDTKRHLFDRLPTYQTLTYPSANKSLSAALVTLREACDLIGYDLLTCAVIVGMESNYDYRVKASTSSASGWFQFINATWDETVERYGHVYGIVNNQTRTLRLDPRANALMGVEFTKNNHNYLQNKTGRSPSIVEVYLAHFLGMGTAVKFINAPQDALGKDLLPREARSNPQVFYTNEQPRTILEIREYFEARLERTILNVKNAMSA